MNNKVKTYIPSIISFMCVFFYFTPWLIAANRANLGLYIISFLWFLVAWIFVVIRAIGIIRQLLREKALDIHKVISALLIVVCYIMVLAGIGNGYIITV